MVRLDMLPVVTALLLLQATMPVVAAGSSFPYRYMTQTS